MADWTPSCNATIPANTEVGGLGIIISFTLTAWITNFVGVIPAWVVLRSNILWVNKNVEHLKYFPPDPSEHTIKATKQVLRGLCDLQLLTGLSIVIAGFGAIPSLTYYHQQLVVYYWWLTLNSFWVARVGLDPTNQSDETTDSESVRSTATSVMNLNDEEAQHVNESNETTRSEIDQSNVTTRTSSHDEETESIVHRDHKTEEQDEQVYDEHSLRSKVRVGAILISVTLGVVYQSIIYREQVQGWDPGDGKLCYLYNDKSIPDSIWLWVAGLAIYVIMLFSTILPYFKVDKFLPWLSKEANKINRRLRKKYETLWAPQPSHMRRSSCASRAFRGLIFRFRQLLAACILLFLVVCWLVQQFLAIWSFGNGWYPILLAAFWGFAAWTTYDIVDQKQSNRDLVEDAENEWGFGQVLPMILLSAIIFQFLDAFYKKRPAVSHRGSASPRSTGHRSPPEG